MQTGVHHQWIDTTAAELRVKTDQELQNAEARLAAGDIIVTGVQYRL